MRVVFPLLHRRRHPLLQALSLLCGLVVAGVLMVFGLLVASVLMAGGALWLIWRRGRQASPVAGSPAPSHQPDVLEGEYVVIRQSRPITH